jgi:hypothetical protein
MTAPFSRIEPTSPHGLREPVCHSSCHRRLSHPRRECTVCADHTRFDPPEAEFTDVFRWRVLDIRNRTHDWQISILVVDTLPEAISAIFILDQGTSDFVDDFSNVPLEEVGDGVQCTVN